MYVFSMKTISVFHRCSVDDRRERIREKFAFSNENAAVWTGPEFSENVNRNPPGGGGPPYKRDGDARRKF